MFVYNYDRSVYATTLFIINCLDKKNTDENKNYLLYYLPHRNNTI